MAAIAANTTTRKAFTVKSDRDSEAVKAVVLEVEWAGITLEQLRNLAVRDIVIRVQGSMRKKLETVKAGGVVKVDAVNYVKGLVDPLTMLANMKKEDRIAYLKANDLI